LGVLQVLKKFNESFSYRVQKFRAGFSGFILPGVEKIIGPEKAAGLKSAFDDIDQFTGIAPAADSQPFDLAKGGFD
jgi:hypothetical protein